MAAVLFWTTTDTLLEKGVEPGSGLDQPAVLEAESALVQAMGEAQGTGDYRPDLVDLVAATGEARPRAIASFLAITRGITARPALARDWSRLWASSVRLDGKDVTEVMKAYQAALDEIGKAAAQDPQTLRAGAGPVIPVRAPAVPLAIPAFGVDFQLEFDLNGIGEGELAALPAVSAELGKKILEQRMGSPFASIEDFEKRCATTLKALGLEPIE